MAKIRKKKAIDRSVLDLAYERINHAFDIFDTIDVSFSGGKDSTVVLNLTLEVARERNRLPLRVFFHDEEAIPYQTEEYARRISHIPDIAFEWYCLPVKHRNACSRQHPWWSPWDRDEEEKWVRPLPPEAIMELDGFKIDGQPRDRLSIPESNGLLHDPAKYGTVGMMMGIRAQESLVRQRIVSYRTHETENYIIHFTEGTSQGNVYKVYPIYDWQTEDVWTAPNLFGWDYNHAYDVMDKAGISPYVQRCSPAYGEEPMRGFFLFKQCFPGVWDKMSMRVPGANTAFLYARSELYGFGADPEKPDDMTWQEFLTHYLQKFAPREAAACAASIKQCIEEHYGKTADPILSEVAHPITGMSWEKLANIAIRGDLKQRRASTILGCITGNESHEQLETIWKKYHDARLQEGL